MIKRLVQMYKDWKVRRNMWKQFEYNIVSVLKLPGVVEYIKEGTDKERRRRVHG